MSFFYLLYLFFLPHCFDHDVFVHHTIHVGLLDARGCIRPAHAYIHRSVPSSRAKLLPFVSPFNHPAPKPQSPDIPSTTDHSPPSPLLASLSTFQLTSETEIFHLLQSLPNKQCELDPIPTSLLKNCASILVPVITKIVNFS